MKAEIKELELKKKELNSLIGDFLALSKKDEKAQNELLKKMVDLENEIQNKYNKLKEQNIL